MESTCLATVKKSSITAGGRGQHATEDLPAGALIRRIEKPFLAIPNNESLYKVCYECLKRAEENLISCTACHAVKYCSTECQERNGPLHQRECFAIGRLKQQGRILPTPTWALVHLLLRYKWLLNAQNQAHWDAVVALVSHIEKICVQAQGASEAWQGIVLQAQMAVHVSQVDELTMAAQLLCIMKMNAFELKTPENNTPLGLCLEPWFAMFNHSCDPNAIVRSDGRKISLVALRPIKKDEEIFIQYIDLDADVIQRRTLLAQQYWFECQCSRCNLELKELDI